jgi:hypothetical protein
MRLGQLCYSAAIASAIACVLTTMPLSADPPDTAGGSTPAEPSDADDASLDEQLLQDLDRSLLDDLEGLQSDGASDETAGGVEEQSELDAELIDQLLEGDDIGAGDDVDPLTQIARRMQVAQERIRLRKTASTTQRLQQQIIDELARIIDEARKSQCGGGGQPKPQPGQANQKKSGQPGANPQSRNPASDSRPTKSTQRLGKEESAEANATRRRALVKETWGHLPQRVRDQMPNTAGEEFLPKYEDIIEDYFERLAEEGREGP